MNKSTFFIGGVIVGIVLGMLYIDFFDTTRETNCNNFIFVNKVTCGEHAILKTEYAELKVVLNNYIEKRKSEGVVTTVGVYFRDLEDGPTMGINEYEEFSPASLLKLATLVTYLAFFVSNPKLLSQELQVEEGISKTANAFNQQYPPTETIIQNKPYSIDELLFRMSVYSDNVASEMLRMYLTSISPENDVLQETYQELGLVPDVADKEFVLSVKRYSSLFRILYSASYLSPRMSEKALEMLSQSTFRNGLVAGVPSEIKVAHKFGERSILQSETSPVELKQLHDCGIVYFPNNPYLLCVMTRGTEYKKLETVISDISKQVYEEVKSRKI